MTNAPERIWIDACGGKWSAVSGGTQREEYIRADLCRPEPQGWQPIETAPKDGRLVLLRQAHGDEWAGTFTAHWSAARGFWFYSQDRSVGNPTHWMPLPAPPAP